MDGYFSSLTLVLSARFHIRSLVPLWIPLKFIFVYLSKDAKWYTIFNRSSFCWHFVMSSNAFSRLTKSSCSLRRNHQEELISNVASLWRFSTWLLRSAGLLKVAYLVMPKGYTTFMAQCGAGIRISINFRRLSNRMLHEIPNQL